MTPERLEELRAMFGRPARGVAISEVLELISTVDKLTRDLADVRGEAAVLSERVIDLESSRLGPNRWANRRNKLHGIVALDRVLGSFTLRRMALHAMPGDRLRQEIERRERQRRGASQGRRVKTGRWLLRLLESLICETSHEVSDG